MFVKAIHSLKLRASVPLKNRPSSNHPGFHTAHGLSEMVAGGHSVSTVDSGRNPAPEVQELAPEKWWLEDDPFLFPRSQPPFKKWWFLFG